MTNYSHEKNAVVAAVTFKMKMQQITKKILQKSIFKAFVELK